KGGASVSSGDFITATEIGQGQLKYTPPTNRSGNALGSFTFQVEDNGGTAGGGNPLDPAVHTFNVNVQSSNDAPSGADKTVTTNEDATYTFAAAVNGVSSDFPISDTNDTPANSLLSVKFIVPPAVAGTFQIGGNTQTPGSTPEVLATALNTVTFKPNQNTTISFQVRDNGGTLNAGVDLDPTANAFNFVVNPVNDAPDGTDKTTTVAEDTTYHVRAADFGFTDSSDAAPGGSPVHFPGPDTFQSVIITALPAANTGTLKRGNTPVTVNQEISKADFDAGLVTYDPPANATGATLATISFRVKDDGGTAFGGVDTDQAANVLTFNVVNVNDPPLGANKDVTVAENAPTGYPFSTADFPLVDPLDTPPNTLGAVRIQTLPDASKGVLKYNNVNVNVGDVIPVADLQPTSNKLIFFPAANYNSDSDANPPRFNFFVKDNGGTATITASDGGTATGNDSAANTNTMIIHVSKVPQAPAGTDKTATTLEDTAYTLSVVDFGFTDPNDNPADAYAGIKIPN